MPAFNLSKLDADRRDNLIAEMRAKWEAVEDAARVYNEALAELRAPIAAALAEYNEVVEEARGFAEDVARGAEEAIDAKSERWQEGEKGQAAIEYRDAWDGVDLGEVEIAWPEDADWLGDAPPHADDMEALPSEMIEP